MYACSCMYTDWKRVIPNECVCKRDENVGNIIGRENISKMSKLQLARLALERGKHTHTRCEFFPRFSYCNKKSFEFSAAPIVWNKVNLIKNDAKIVCAIESEFKMKLKLSSAKCKSCTKSEMKFSKNCSQFEREESRVEMCVIYEVIIQLVG